MKKILFATTALVATAGVAAADVTFGGYGRFGLIYVEDAQNETTITSRFRLQIDATAESDAGITFGARARIQQDNDDSVLEGTRGDDASSTSGRFRPDRIATGINGVRFFARAGGLELGVGNIFGALEFMPGMYPIDLGLTGHNYDYTAYNFRGAAYDSDDAGSAGFNGVEVMYSFGDFSFHLSYDQIDDLINDLDMAGDRTAAHVAYTWNGWTFALGGQDSDFDGDTNWAISASGDLGPVFVSVAYADNGDDGPFSGDHWVLAGRYDLGAATDIEAYVADADYWDDTSFGIDFNHDLGGGTSLRGGISNGGSLGDSTAVDFGVRFNF